MSFQSVLNNLKDVNSSTAKVNQNLTNSNPDQTPSKLGQINTQIVGITKNVTGTVGNITNIGKSVSDVSKKLSNSSLLKGTAVGNFLGGLSETLTGKDTIEYTPTDDELKSDERNGELTGLKGFYQKFSGNSSIGANQIDTLNTFECWFEFFPNAEIGQETFLENLISENKINTDEYKNFTKGEGVANPIDYENAKTSDACILDLGINIQKLTLPNIQDKEGGTIQTHLGDFPVNGISLKPDGNTIMMDVLNMRNPIHEMLFYPWMREVHMYRWQYKSQPYTTANIHVSLYEHSNIEYIFVNCRPTQIMSYTPSQEPNSQFSRQVTFIFDYVFIKEANKLLKDSPSAYGPGSQYTFNEMDSVEEKSTLDKVLDVAGATNYAATNILKI